MNIKTLRHQIDLMAYDRPMTKLDDVDRKMIDELRADGRMSIPMLAERIGVSRATAYTRFDRLVDDGVVTGFTAVVDPAAVGTDVSALVMVNVLQGHWRTLAAQLRSIDGVEWVGVATGSFDFVIHARAWSLDHLRDVVLTDVQGIEGIRSSETIVLLDEFDQRRRPVAAPWASRPDVVSDEVTARLRR